MVEYAKGSREIILLLVTNEQEYILSTVRYKHVICELVVFDLNEIVVLF